MGHGEYRIAAQSGAKGYFGKVILDAEAFDSKGEVAVEFDQSQASGWQSGARFGIDFVLDHIAKKQFFPQGGRVHVRIIQGHPVDTNNVVIAYVAANALFNALGIEPAKRPNLDEANGLFVFPK